MLTKICSTCRCDKPLDAFNLKKGGPLGRRSECKACRKEGRDRNKERDSERRREKYALTKDLPETKEKHHRLYLRAKDTPAYKAYRESNKAKYAQRKREKYPEHREKILARQKTIRDANKDLANQRVKERRLANLEKRREYEREYGKRRRAKDLQFKLAGNLRTRINHCVKERSDSSQELLGCSIQDYMLHLQSLFQVGMNWDNYGTYWSIDHIRPCASFDLTDPEQQRICFHWSNCQPLTISQNSSKNDSLPTTTVD